MVARGRRGHESVDARPKLVVSAAVRRIRTTALPTTSLAATRRLGVEKVCDFEGSDNRNLFSRICLLNDVLEDAKSATIKVLGIVLAWLRLSSTKQLPWYEGAQLQGKDMAHLQKVIADRLAWSQRNTRTALLDNTREWPCSSSPEVAATATIFVWAF